MSQVSWQGSEQALCWHRCAPGPGTLGSAGCTGALVGSFALALDAVRAGGVRVWWGQSEGRPRPLSSFTHCL